jgi:signal peptidase I
MTSAADRESGPAATAPDTSAPGPGPGRPGRRRLRAVAEWTVVLVVAVLLAAGLRTLVFQPFKIPSTSMVPTLEVGDRILVQKAFFNWHDVHQGDIVVFTHPPADNDCSGPQDTDLVKRVVAVGGQTIYSADGVVYVDGRKLSEGYLPKYDPLGPAIPGASARSPYRVPAGDFYVLGDNRAISCDSRYWGPVKGSTVVGKAVLLWWRGHHPEVHGL